MIKNRKIQLSLNDVGALYAADASPQSSVISAETQFGDAHALAQIAGHSSIVITMRYVHPQADAIERAFAMAHGKVARKRLPKSEGEKKQSGS
jgi:hypothetical protein